jgi:hypothetical protein
MNDLLVCEMRNHLEAADALQSVLSLVSLLELHKHSMHQHLAYVGQLGVYDGNESSKHVSEIG